MTTDPTLIETGTGKERVTVRRLSVLSAPPEALVTAPEAPATASPKKTPRVAVPYVAPPKRRPGKRSA